MGATVSQITSITIVYSTVYPHAEERKHQRSASLAFVRGINREPVNSPHKWPVTRKMFLFDDVIMDSRRKVHFQYEHTTNKSEANPMNNLLGNVREIPNGVYGMNVRTNERAVKTIFCASPPLKDMITPHTLQNSFLSVSDDKPLHYTQPSCNSETSVYIITMTS